MNPSPWKMSRFNSEEFAPNFAIPNPKTPREKRNPLEIPEKNGGNWKVIWVNKGECQLFREICITQNWVITLPLCENPGSLTLGPSLKREKIFGIGSSKIVGTIGPQQYPGIIKSPQP